MKIKPKKQLGQNFLEDESVAARLVSAAKVGKGDTVLEVGAGTGAVTRELARQAGKVIAVEFDRDLIPVLTKNMKDFKNVEIVNQDILKLQMSRWELKDFKIVGSIPYQITSPLIHQILHATPRPQSITLIVQKEVAEKLAAQSPKATYLSNFVANFGEARVLEKIGPEAFNPAPKVDSAIMQITLYDKPKIEDTYKLEKMLHHGFLQPRKMVHHRFPAQVLEESGVRRELRPANLLKEDWERVYQNFYKGENMRRKKDRRGGGVWIKTGA